MDIKDEGTLTRFAGLQLKWSPGGLEISQADGIERGTLRYFPQAAGLTPTSLPATYDGKTRGNSLRNCDRLNGGDSSFRAKYPNYMSFMALILYYATMTHGPLLYTTVFLCRFMDDPNEECYKAGVALMACLYHSRHEGIRYERSGWRVPQPIREARLETSLSRNYGIYAAPDGAWKLRTDDGMNMTYAGWIIFMLGGAIDFGSRLIKVICHSSAEAEIASGCFAGKRCQFVRHLINELKEHGVGDGIEGPIIFVIDNSATGPLTSNVGVSKKTEHFLRWQHYLRWLVYNKYAIVIWVNTDDETGDVMTKVVPSTTFMKHRKVFYNKI